jgi:hypothetical protein
MGATVRQAVNDIDGGVLVHLPPLSFTAMTVRLSD